MKLPRRLRFFEDRLKIDLTWRPWVSLLTGLIVGIAIAITWTYAYGAKLVATADAHRDAVLKNYPTFSQVLQLIRDERDQVDRTNYQRHQEVMPGLDRIEDRVNGR